MTPGNVAKAALAEVRAVVRGITTDTEEEA